MATNGWRTGTPLNELLVTNYSTFNFFQAVRLLEGMDGDEIESSKNIEFSQSLGDEFRGASIQKLSIESETGAASMNVDLGGLTGPKGPMPVAFSRWVEESGRKKKRALADFFDLFNSRYIRLFYLAKRRHSLGLQNDLPQDSWLGKRGECLNGLHELSHRLDISPRFLLGMTALLANTRPSKTRLLKVLRQYTATGVEVDDQLGEWQKTAQEHHTKLGKTSLNSRSGVPCLLGKKSWLQQARLRVTLGPVSYSKYESLVPGQENFRSLVAMLALLTDCRWTIELIIKIDYETIPRSGLNVGESPYLQLRRSSWLKSRPRAYSGDKPGTLNHEPDDTQQDPGATMPQYAQNRFIIDLTNWEEANYV